MSVLKEPVNHGGQCLAHTVHRAASGEACLKQYLRLYY